MENKIIILNEKPFVDKFGNITDDTDIGVEKIDSRRGIYAGRGHTSGRSVEYNSPDLDDVKKVARENPERIPELKKKMDKEQKILDNMRNRIGRFEDSQKSGNRAAKEIFNNAKKTKITNESFSDYELYQILEENGYETDEENLNILKEGLESNTIEILDEGKKLKRTRAILGTVAAIGGLGSAAHTGAAINAEKSKETEYNAEAQHANDYIKHKNDGNAARKEYREKYFTTNGMPNSKYYSSDAINDRNRINSADEKAAASLASVKKAGESASYHKKQAKKHTKIATATGSAAGFAAGGLLGLSAAGAAKAAKKKDEKYYTTDKGLMKSGDKPLKEGYSDYELYQILEENDYEPDEENLQILKEGLESGDIELLD